MKLAAEFVLVSSLSFHRIISHVSAFPNLRTGVCNMIENDLGLLSLMAYNLLYPFLSFEILSEQNRIIE